MTGKVKILKERIVPGWGRKTVTQNKSNGLINPAQPSKKVFVRKKQTAENRSVSEMQVSSSFAQAMKAPQYKTCYLYK